MSFPRKNLCNFCRLAHKNLTIEEFQEVNCQVEYLLETWRELYVMDKNDLTIDKDGLTNFRQIVSDATKVFKSGQGANLRRDELLTVVSQIDNTPISNILNSILGLFNECEEIKVIGNAKLNSRLVDFANRISKKKKEDEKIVQLLQKEFV